ncbi:High-affinity zinc uptake system ATP-binding protein ZnuC [bioreactor metagenome]|uniref:High-affinity zinc uptake system ATP-binding protein ZnuC n=1 Tax=bioreactor metagenome TaxID=1076179 RepID=A0A644T8N4_9ZZZZ|nr:metal ABC transporter ATP-binding protein [Negativicutes bacterium]
MVNLSEVTFAYDQDIVIQNLTLTIDRGSFTAVIGPNGAGKSTVLKLIAGLLTPRTGTVMVSGQDVRTARLGGLIGYVPQNYGKNVCGFPATVEEVVRLGTIAGQHDRHFSQSAVNHIVNHMLELVGCQGIRKKRIGDLSGGQQQRVMVARALAGNPELLLLDEPTSGVDYEASEKIYELLGQLNQNLDVTVIMVSHDIEKATHWADKVACINRGLCFFGDSQEFNLNHIQSRHLWFYNG